MELETFDGWTIDRRLKQLRKVRESDDKILFVDFDSYLGDMILTKKILDRELSDLNAEMKEVQDIADEYNNGDINPLVAISQTMEYQRITKELKEVSEVINKLERELK